MATITTLGFNIRSSWDGSGTRAAQRDLLRLQATSAATGAGMGRAATGMGALVTAATALAPALAPITAATVSVTGATLAMAASGGAALGVYGAAMHGAIRRTLDMAEAGKKLDPSQKSFISNVDKMKSAWDRFIVSTSPTTLRAATTVVQGLTAGIGRLKPLVDATAPAVQRVADAFRNWAAGDGLQRFITTITQHGVPALNALLNAGRHVLATLGIGFRTFAPEGVKLAQALERGALAMRQWAEGGGFTRFLQTVNANAPTVRAFFDALGAALRNVSTAMMGLGPLSLIVATGLLRIVAAMPPSVIQALVVAFVAWRTAMMGMMIIGTIVTLVTQLRTAFLALRGAWMILSLAFATTPLGLVITAVVALVAGIVYLATQTRFFQTVWNAVWTGIRVATLAIWNALQVAWRGLVNGILIAWNAVGMALRVAWTAVWNALRVAAVAVWTGITAAWRAFINGLALVWTTVGMALRTAWTAVWNALRTVAVAVWNGITAAWRAFVTGLATAWTAVSAGLRIAWTAVWTALRTAAVAAWAAITAAWRAFVTGLATAWTAVSAGLRTAWNAVWTALRTAAVAAWNAITAAWRAFVNGLATAWTATAAGLRAAWNAVWTALRTAAVAAWNAITAAWRAFVSGLATAWTATSAALRSAWTATWNALRTSAVAVWNAMRTAWTSTWNAIRAAGVAVWAYIRNYLMAWFSQIRQAFTNALNFMRQAWTAGWNAIRSAGVAVWSYIRNYVMSWWSQLRNSFSTALSWMRNYWSAAWGQIRSAGVAIWSYIRNYVMSWWSQLRNSFSTALTWMRQYWNAAWQQIRAFGVQIWAYIRQYIMAWWSQLRQAFSTALTWIRQYWNAAWTQIRQFGVSVWSYLRGYIMAWWSQIREAFGTALSAIRKVWGETWEAMKSTASRLWNEIGNIIEKAINGIITVINGLVSGFNKITSFLKIDVKVGEVPKVNFNFAEGGMVPGYANGGPVKNLKRGGTVSGYRPGKDTVPAMLSPGEGVLTPEAVRGLGGPGFVNSANRTFAGHRGAGKGAPKLTNKYTGDHMGPQSRGAAYAFGGMVVPHFAVGGMTSAALARAGGGFSIMQGEYSNSVAASAGTHSGGGVVDIAAGPGNGPGMVARLRRAGFAAWLRTPAQGFAYHIHAVLMNHPNLSPQARAQVASYLQGGNGLGVGGGGGGGGFDILGELAPHVGKILHNVYNGLSPLADVGGMIATMFGFGSGEDQGGLFGSGIGPDFGPDVVGTVGEVAGKITGADTTIGGQMMEMLGQAVLSILDKKNIAEGLGDAGKGIKEFGDGGAGGMGQIAAGFGKRLLEGVMPDFLIKKKSESTFNAAMFGGGGTGDPRDVKQWAGLAAQALARAGLGAGQLNAFLALMAAESGGNPMAMNNWDSNAAKGQASRGLMQVIPSTFAAYRDRSLSGNIFDPLANMTAAANYIKARYGGRVPGSPYARGTNHASRGWHLVGENGPEMRYFRGGERVANARRTYGELRRMGGDGGTVIEKGAIQIDARGASVEAVREMETNLVPKLRMAMQAGVGNRR